MTQPPAPDPESLAARFDSDYRALPLRTTAAIRALRQACTRQLRGTDAAYVVAVSWALLRVGQNWVAWELLRHHRPAFESMDAGSIEVFGAGIDSWDDVDGFARTLAGPAWLQGLITDATVHEWACSPDLWWRRVALVCTVAFNMRSQGGYGDAPRTLAVCEMLAADSERMVQQAISWALRELVVHDAAGVAAFIEKHEGNLSASTKREVRHKLATGLKNPRRSATVGR